MAENMMRIKCTGMIFIFLMSLASLVFSAPASDIFISDVTPTSFNVVWSLSKSSKETEVKVYSEPIIDPINEITSALIIQNHGDTSASPQEAQALSHGIMRVRVSGLQSDTSYFIQAIAYPADLSASDITPSTTPLIPVRTQKISQAVSNDTFMMSVVENDETTPADGAMLLMSLSGSPYPVSAMVGETGYSGQVLINSSNFYDSTGVNRELSAGEPLSVVALGGTQGRANLETTVPVNNKLGELKIISPSTIQLQPEADSDADGIPNWYEILHNLADSDGDADDDTLTDLQEYQLGSNPNNVDTDSDGISDTDEYAAQTSLTSEDTDLDGINDNQETTYGTNPLDSDWDNDGVSDGYEVAAGTDPLDASSTPTVDIDGDTIDDQVDNCLGIPNPDQLDMDADGIGNACDTDIDGDGIINVDDNAPNSSNASQLDGDLDGIGDAGDNCPLEYNPIQTDTDSDGQGNACDADDDNDNINDFQAPVTPSDSPFKLAQVFAASEFTLDINYNSNAEIAVYKFDITKYDPNITEGEGDDLILLGTIKLSNFEWVPAALTGTQLTDEGWLFIQVDGFGCGCINTRDGDSFTLSTGTGDIKVYLPASSNFDFASGLFVSIDGTTYDNFYTGAEQLATPPVKSAFDNLPLDNCRLVPNTDQLDSDNDGMGDVCDITADDLDGDGLLNAVDNCPDHHNPSQADTDADEIGDACDSDIDGDGLNNSDENLMFTNPLLIDTDSDGISDADEDSDFDGLSNLVEITNGLNPKTANGNYSKGLNLFHYPYSTPVDFTAFNLLVELGGPSVVASIKRRNPDTGKLEAAEYNGTVLQGVDFPVVTGEGYILQAVQAFTKTFNASILCNDLNLAQGISMISLSCFPHNFSAYNLLEHMGGSSVVSSVQHFNRVTGLFETATFLNGSPVGVDFNLSNTESYLVHAKQAVTVASPITAPVVLDMSIIDGAIVNEAEIVITGSVTDPSDVVTINGQTATVTGINFSLPLGLIEGQNVITVVVNNPNNLSTSQVLTVTLKLPPTIAIDSHTDGAVIHQYDTVIYGSTAKPVSQVLINGNPAVLTSSTSFRYGAHTCDFGQMGSTCTASEPRIELVDGANAITIHAIGLDGVNDTKVLNLNRQPLEVNAINPGIVSTNFNLVLPSDITDAIASHAVTVPSATVFLAGINSFNDPFHGTLEATGAVSLAGNEIASSFSLDTHNVLSGNYDLGIKYIYKSISGSHLYHANLVLRINVPVSSDINFISSALPGNNFNTSFETGFMSGTVPLSVTSVIANGVPAELYTQLSDKRYFAMGVPLNIGENSVVLESRGEAFDNGDQSAVTQKIVTVNRIDSYSKIINATTLWQHDHDITPLPPTFLNNNVCANLGCFNFENSAETKLNAVSWISGAYAKSCDYIDENGDNQYGCRSIRYKFNAALQSVPPSGIYSDVLTIDYSSTSLSDNYPVRIPIKTTVFETTDLPIVIASDPAADATIPSTYTSLTVEVSNDSSAEVNINGILATHRHQDLHLYTADVPLVNGANEITVTALSYYGQYQATLSPVYIDGFPIFIPDDPADHTSTYTYNINVIEQAPPQVSVTSHSDGDSLGIKLITLEATVDNPSLLLSLHVNGIDNGQPTINGNQVTWSGVDLKDGPNQIQIYAQHYVSPVVNLTITHVPPPAPVVAITSPQSGDVIINTDNYWVTVTGTVADPDATVIVNYLTATVTPGTPLATFSAVTGLVPGSTGLNKYIQVQATGATGLYESITVTGISLADVAVQPSTTISDSVRYGLTSAELRDLVTLESVITDMPAFITYTNESFVEVPEDTVNGEPAGVLISFDITAAAEAPQGMHQMTIAYNIRDRKGDIVKTIGPYAYWIYVE